MGSVFATRGAAKVGYTRDGCSVIPSVYYVSARSNRSSLIVGHQVEIMSVAVLGTMIEDAALVPKLIERRITPAITQVVEIRREIKCLSNI